MLDATNFIAATTNRASFAARLGEAGDPSRLTLAAYGIARLAFDA
jgi:hypothetical protein